MRLKENLILEPMSEQGIEDSLRIALRDPDIKELNAVGFSNSKQGILDSIEQSAVAYLVRNKENREAIGVFGLRIDERAIGGKLGIPWFVASEKIENYPLELFRKAEPVVKTMLKSGGGYLTNYVWTGHTQSVRMLEILGFSFDESTITQVNGLNFIRFYMKKRS